jgi:hypothetical protein
VHVPPPGASRCVLAPSLCHHCPGAVRVGVEYAELVRGWGSMGCVYDMGWLAGCAMGCLAGCASWGRGIRRGGAAGWGGGRDCKEWRLCCRVEFVCSTRRVQLSLRLTFLMVCELAVCVVVLWPLQHAHAHFVY